VADGEDHTLRRQKREWIIPPKKLWENMDYTSDAFIAKIRSDEETRTTIRYSLEGPGASQDPKGLFTVDEKQGTVKIHGILDREKIPSFFVEGVARFLNGSKAEKNIPLHIVVLDQNDCPPVFSIQPAGAVPELSPTGTSVIKITATDADEPDTPNSLVTYSIAQQIPAGPRMFQIDPQSGLISIQQNTLDREVQENYMLIIYGRDNGPGSRNTGTGTVSITVLDVNDNVPFLEKSNYEGSVEENAISVEVVRIKAIDIDQVNTDNWRAVYTIISGNEAGYFNITTDHSTNEGIIMATKPLDYEELKAVNLRVVVSNKAKYHSSVVVREPTVYTIKISVLNMPEGPRFQPTVKVISISEDHKTIDLKRVITTYQAIDSDTLQTATSVKYYKGLDVANWLNIDAKTAEIRLNKVPDRESVHLINGTYYAQIICITDEHPSKTATGTIAIQVEDFNDHCPVLTSMTQTLCYGESVLYVTAIDRDNFPNAEPFDFKLVTTDKEGEWIIERLNDTATILRARDHLWPGHHMVSLEVRDQQGKLCDVQQLQVTICTCNEAKVCKEQGRKASDVILGAGGVLTMLLGLLLLLLVSLLLLFCVCGGAATAAGFRAFPTDQTQHLITYHTEGVGEDKEVPLLQIPLEAHKTTQGQVGSGEKGWGWGGGVEEGLLTTRDEWDSGHQISDAFDQRVTMATIRGMGAFSGMALSEGFLGNYYSKKAKKQMEQHFDSEPLRVYDYEDRFSTSGSLENICEHLQEEDNLAFLDDLGPKFKPLAELCCGTAIETQIGAAVEPPPPKPFRPVPSGARIDVGVQGAMGGARAAASSHASVSASASTSASTTRIAASDYHESGGASSPAVLTHAARVPGHTLLLEQPAAYYTSAPVYVMEQQARPTLLLAARPVMGVQENVVLVDHRAAGVAFPTPHASTTLELKRTQTQARAAGRSATDTGGMLGFPGLGIASGSGSVRVVESERVQTVEPLLVRQSASQSSTSMGKIIRVGGHVGGVSAGLWDASTSPNADVTSQQNAVGLTVPQGSSHQHVQAERVSVVKQSFQSTSTS
ncbi:hypothetical protein P4O66_008702, partial [Electrophorus voltai]